MNNVYIQAVLNENEASTFGPFEAVVIVGPRLYVCNSGRRSLFGHLYDDLWGVAKPFEKDGSHKYIRLDFFPRGAN